jgi:hypothetical protein
MRRVRLLRHPSTPCLAVTGLHVRVSARCGGRVALTYTLAGSPGALSIPEPARPERVDGLWRHTCFEAFVMADGGPAYREFNFSPSGEWAAYAFRRYRDGGPLEPMPAPAIAVHVGNKALTLGVTLPRMALPGPRALRVGLAAVIEEADGRISYWALHHPPGKPDFHHPGAFALELPGP